MLSKVVELLVEHSHDLRGLQNVRSRRGFREDREDREEDSERKRKRERCETNFVVDDGLKLKVPEDGDAVSSAVRRIRLLVQLLDGDASVVAVRR